MLDIVKLHIVKTTITILSQTIYIAHPLCGRTSGSSRTRPLHRGSSVRLWPGDPSPLRPVAEASAGGGRADGAGVRRRVGAVHGCRVGCDGDVERRSLGDAESGGPDGRCRSSRLQC